MPQENRPQLQRWRGAAYALAAAVLFGASTPFAKQLLTHVDAWMLAGLLYLGAGLGLMAVRLVWRRMSSSATAEAPIAGSQWGWLAGAILAGGVIGPVLLMVGLAAMPASSASLLLNLEVVFTALLAWFVFRENFDRRIAFGMIFIAAGAVILSWQGRLAFGDVLGPAAIAGACLAWALDNNLTRKISLGDAMQITMLKGLVAGTVNIALALMQGAAWPGAALASQAGVIGLFGYGLSLVLFVVALRHIGSARTGAYFAVAPFVGAVIAIGAFGETVSVQFVIAGAAMALGVLLHLTERHDHEHVHEPMTHAHRHVHDGHHRHEHGPTDPPGETHSHAHQHAPIRHRHPHYPDTHHMHDH